MTVVVGIIGPPCSGKSTVAKALTGDGISWVDADKIAKAQLQTPQVIARLTQHFGEHLVGTDGQIDRRRLADAVFDRDAAAGSLEVLEGVVHPPTSEEIWWRLRQALVRGDAIVVLDIPLLIEKRWERVCDEVLCLRVAPGVHAELIAARGWDDAELQRRTARQLSAKIKQARATRVIDNDGDRADLQERIESLARTWRVVSVPDTHCRPAVNGGA